MAMRKFFRRAGGFRRRSNRTVPRWSAQSSGFSLASNASNFSTLVGGSTTGGLVGPIEAECKLVRIVGQIDLMVSANVTGNPAIGLGIIKSTGFTGAPTVGSTLDPLVATELATRDWLFACSRDVPPNAFNNAWIERIPLDIKVQRRLKQEEEVRLVATRPADGLATNVIINIDVRILIVVRL